MTILGIIQINPDLVSNSLFFSFPELAKTAQF